MKMSNAGYKTETYHTADVDGLPSLTAKNIGICIKMRLALCLCMKI